MRTEASPVPMATRPPAWRAIGRGVRALYERLRGTHGGHAADAAAQPWAAASAPAAQELPTLLNGVLPVWREHLGAVNTTSESAVTELLSSLGSICGQFESAGFRGTSAKADETDSPMLDLLTVCERELRPVIDVMAQIVHSKRALVERVSEMVQVANELQGMAGDVNHVAMQTNLLAINAAVEAAHAGDAGAGFAVIAKEIRQLSHQSARASRHISERMASVKTMIVDTVSAATTASADERVAIEQASDVVRDVLGHIQVMAADAQRMRAQAGVIRGDIERLLLNLQFQDRISQIISVVDGDMHRLLQLLEEGQALPDPQAWLQELQQHYTTREQRRPHAAAAWAAAAHDSGDAATPATTEEARPAPAAVVFF